MIENTFVDEQEAFGDVKVRMMLFLETRMLFLERWMLVLETRMLFLETTVQILLVV